MRILVIGGTGLVGSNVVDHAEQLGFDVLGTFHSKRYDSGVQLDKTDADATRRLVTAYDPDVVVDTAAFHVVDDCETDRRRAWDVNVLGTRNAAAAADLVGAQFVYLSTDYVFSERSGTPPYRERDPVAPVNYYGRTKYAGEGAARLASRATVLRPSVVFGLAADNFATLVLEELSVGNEFRVVTDQVATPTYAPDLATACLAVAQSGVTGLFHAGGPERLSRYEFTKRLVDAFGLDASRLLPVRTDELEFEAPRPADTSLDSTALSETIDHTFTSPTRAFEAMYERDGDV